MTAIPPTERSNASAPSSGRAFALVPFFAPMALLGLVSCDSGGGLPGPLRDALSGNGTVEAILARGLPRWDALVPALPEAFSRGEGIATDERGVPASVRAERGLLADTLGVGGAQTVFDEAQGLSREPLVLAREAELAARTLLSPLLDVLSDARLFSRLDGLGGNAGDAEADASGSGAALTGEEGRSAPKPSSHPLFRALRERGELAVRFPKSDEGLPAAVFLSAPRDGAGLTFRPVWLDARGRGLAPAEVSLSLGDGGNSSVTLKFAPEAAKGLTRVFPSGLGSCEGDAIVLKATRGAKGEAGMEIQRRGCASDASRARVGGFSLTRDSNGRYLVGGAFRAAQDLAKAGGLRASFGPLPLFAFRAAIVPGNDAPLAVDVAALPTDVADAPSPTTAGGAPSPFASFGVSKVVTDYAVSSFWKSSYGSNRAVRTILCDAGGAVSTGLAAFCSQSVSGTAAATAFAEAADAARRAKPALSLVTDADAIVDALGALVSVLSIRNTMVFALDQPPRYIDSDPATPTASTFASTFDSTYAAESAPERAAGRESLASAPDPFPYGKAYEARAALSGVRDPFPYAKARDATFTARAITPAELEAAIPLDGAELLSRTARAACEALLADTLAKAGKGPEAATRLCAK